MDDATLHTRSLLPSRGWKPETPIRALIFDFDGLILDTETADHQAWQEVYQDHGTQLPLNRWLECVGASDTSFDPYDQLERQLGELVDRERIRQTQHARVQEILDERSTLPGVKEFISNAQQRRMSLAVASSSPRAWVEEHLSRLGLLAQFDLIRCPGAGDCAGPSPQLYLSVVADLGVDPARAIAVADSPPGIMAAKGAGLYCISVPNALTRSLSMDAADLALLSLSSTTLDDVIERARRCGRRAAS